MKYDVTKKQCQEAINKDGNKVCTRCGRKIVPLKTVTNSGIPTYWRGCMHGGKKGDWGHFCYGVTKEQYNLARKLVLEDNYKFQSSTDTKDFDYWFRESMDRVCDILTTIDYMKNSKPRYTFAKLKEQKLRGWGVK